MTTPILLDLPPYPPAKLAEFQRDFYRDGFLHIPALLTPEEVAALKTATDKVFEDEQWQKTDNIASSFVATRLFETSPVFEDMLTREPIIGLVESILGPDCHLVAQNVIRNAPGQAIDKFHADDIVMLPIADGMERHDPRLTMPVFLMTAMVALTDTPSVEYGPTEYVPGSHYSGRAPNDGENPVFEGRGPVPILCKAGDIYLHNGQCWHRGAPNTSDRTRYILGLTYGQRWVSQRFYPFIDYRLPRHVLDRADERRKRVLGFHPRGPYS